MSTLERLKKPKPQLNISFIYILCFSAGGKLLPSERSFLETRRTRRMEHTWPPDCHDVHEALPRTRIPQSSPPPPRSISILDIRRTRAPWSGWNGSWNEKTTLIFFPPFLSSTAPNLPVSAESGHRTRSGPPMWTNTGRICCPVLKTGGGQRPPSAGWLLIAGRKLPLKKMDVAH